MNSSVPPTGRGNPLLMLPAEDAPEVFEQKAKGKMPKAKSALPKPKTYKPAKAYKRRPGYRLDQLKRDPDDNSEDGENT